MSFPRYPAYKDSGVEWLGEVPEHWEVTRLGFLCSKIGSGKTPLGGGEAYLAEGVLFIRSQNVYDDGLFLDDVVYVSEATDTEQSWARVMPGDVLLNITGASLGRTCLVPDDFQSANVNQHVCILRLANTALRHFVSMALKSSGMKSQFDAAQNGAAREGLNFAQISKLALAVPSPEEQASISLFLSHETAKIDALIAEQQRLIELLQEKRQAVISHAVTKGLDPDASMKDSGVEWLGEVPEHWEVRPLKHLAIVQTGMAKGKDLEGIETVDIPYLRVANVQDGYLDLDEVHLLSVPLTSIERYLLKEGDVLMNEGGDFDKLGRGCVWSGEIEPCVHQNHVFAVRPHSVSGEWLNAYTTSKAANSYFISRSKQSTNLASISSSNLMGLSVPLPPAEEVRGILVRLNELVKEIDDLKQSATQATDLLQERRSALISAAVTGQIDVRGLVPEAVAA